MNAISRFHVATILGQQRTEDADSFVLWDIIKKVRLPDEQRREIFREFRPGEGILDEEAIKRIEDVEVELEKAEVRKLRDTLKAWRGFTPPDTEWWAPLKKQLEAET